MSGDDDTRRWRRYGERGVLFQLSSLAEVHALDRAVRASGLARECVPGAETLFVEPIDDSIMADGLAQQILELPTMEPTADTIRMHTIAVRYDGIDLPDVAALANCSIEEVIGRHVAPAYTVAFLGFSRSFPYLVGLDPLLIVPRLASPRTMVPAGSVGMGAGFTGIYPAASPGGWRLLGHTDSVLFDETCDPPNVLGIGDRVRFEPVPR